MTLEEIKRSPELWVYRDDSLFSQPQVCRCDFINAAADQQVVINSEHGIEIIGAWRLFPSVGAAREYAIWNADHSIERAEREIERMTSLKRQMQEVMATS